MTSFQAQSAISRKELTQETLPILPNIPANIPNNISANIANIHSNIPANLRPNIPAIANTIPRLPTITIPPLPQLSNIAKQTQTQTQRRSLSPNKSVANTNTKKVIRPPQLQIQSHSLSPTIPTTNNRKRLRESPNTSDNQDTKRRKIAEDNTNNASNLSNLLNKDNANTTVANATVQNNNGNNGLTPIAPLTPHYHRCSIPTTAHSQSQSVTNANTNTANTTNTAKEQMSVDNNKEIHIALQNLAALVSKNSTESPNKSNTNTNGTLTPLSSTHSNTNHGSPYKGLGIALPNIISNANPIAPISVTDTNHSNPMDQFLFGDKNKNKNKSKPNTSNTNTNTATASQNKPSPSKNDSMSISPALQTQLLTAMSSIGGAPSMTGLTANDIDSELQKELNKKQMRKIISQQLENLRQQLLAQEKEDEAKLQALKFMKMVQYSHGNAPKNLQITNSAINHRKKPLPLPSFMPMRATCVMATLSGYDRKRDKSGSNDRKMYDLPVMSSSNEWNSVSDGSSSVKSKYEGHGRETIIAATGKIQPRKDMDGTQQALLCNLMVELCFTEGLESKAENMVQLSMNNMHNINGTLKIDPEICLNMNLNSNSRMNGFSSIISSRYRGNGGNNLVLKPETSQPSFNFVPPTLHQTKQRQSLKTVRISMPGLETEGNLSNDRLLSSSDSSSSSSASSESDEDIDMGMGNNGSQQNTNTNTNTNRNTNTNSSNVNIINMNAIANMSNLNNVSNVNNINMNAIANANANTNTIANVNRNTFSIKNITDINRVANVNGNYAT